MMKRRTFLCASLYFQEMNSYSLQERERKCSERESSISFIGKGDLVHSESEYNDPVSIICWEISTSSIFARYHLYLHPAKEEILDLIHWVPDLEVYQMGSRDDLYIRE